MVSGSTGAMEFVWPDIWVSRATQFGFVVCYIFLRQDQLPAAPFGPACPDLCPLSVPALHDLYDAVNRGWVAVPLLLYPEPSRPAQPNPAPQPTPQIPSFPTAAHSVDSIHPLPPPPTSHPVPRLCLSPCTLFTVAFHTANSFTKFRQTPPPAEPHPPNTVGNRKHEQKKVASLKENDSSCS